uniref:Uncharacterized protein n=1 Tax=Setaria italica TaxID=4555 RepID=K3XU98_SETIT
MTLRSAHHLRGNTLQRRGLQSWSYCNLSAHFGTHCSLHLANRCLIYLVHHT